MSNSLFFYNPPKPEQNYLNALDKNEPSSIDELQLQFRGQNNFINAMKAFNYDVNLMGVCFGLSESARDAFLSNSLPLFLKIIDYIDQIYKLCIQEATDKLQALQQQARIIINQNFALLNQTIDMAFNVADSYNPEFYLRLNDTMAAIKTAINADCILNETLKNEPGSSFSLLVNYIFTSRTDVVTETKFTILKSIADYKKNKELSELCNGLSFKGIVTDLRRIFLNKEKEIEKIFQHLNIVDEIKSIVTESIKNISPEQLYLLNIIKAIFDRIMCYQNPYSFPGIFPHLDTKHKKTFEKVYPIVETHELSNTGSITQVYSLSGCYTHADLVQYFRTLKMALAGFKHLISLTLTSATHAMFMGYNPSTQTFTLFDPNNKVIESSDERVLATYVNQGFSFRAIGMLGSPLDNYTPYSNSYLYILSTQQLVFCDNNAKLHTLVIHDKTHFQNTLNLSLIKNDQSHENVIKCAISKNKNHSGLGSPYTIFATDIWHLSTNNTPQLHDAMVYWHTKSSSQIHAVQHNKVKATDQSGATWLQVAILNGDTNLITRILATNPQTNNSEIFLSLTHVNPDIQKQLFALNPLTCAASKNYGDFFIALLNTTPHPNKIITKNITALHAAVYCQNLDLIRYLLSHNADPDFQPFDFIDSARKAAEQLKFDEVTKIFMEYDEELYKKTVLLNFSSITLGRLFNRASPELLFKLIEIGDIERSGILIVHNPIFLYQTIDYKDRHGRVFKEMTAFQYALWLLNADLWDMIAEYLPIRVAFQQFQQHELGNSLYALEHGIYSQLPLSEINKTMISGLRTYLNETFDKYQNYSEPSTPENHSPRNNQCSPISS